MEMIKLNKKEENILARLDKCRYGLWIRDGSGEALAKKNQHF